MEPHSSASDPATPTSSSTGPLLAVVLLAAVLGGCAWHEYEARPLDPQLGVQQFATRSLDAPALADFARVNVSADQPFPPAVWDLDALFQAALFYRSELDVARAERDRAVAAIESASARPNPTLAFDGGFVSNASDASQRWIFGGILDVPIETADKRDLRTLAAEERALAADVDLGTAVWAVRAEVVSAWADLAAARGDHSTLRAEAAAFDERMADLAAQLEAGRISRLAFSQVEQERALLELDVEAARTREERARAALARSIGVPLAALDTVTLATDVGAGTLPEVPVPLAARDRGLRSRLDLRRALVDYAVAEAELRLEIARQYPDFHVAPGLSWDQGDHKYLLGFSLELPVANRNEGPIAEAEARRVAAGARFLALQERAVGAIESARLAYAGALRERAAARAAHHDAELQEQRLTRAVEAGAAERAALLDARVGSARLARAVAAADARAVAALGDLELQLQEPLVGTLDLGPILEPAASGESGT